MIIFAATASDIDDLNLFLAMDDKSDDESTGSGEYVPHIPKFDLELLAADVTVRRGENGQYPLQDAAKRGQFRTFESLLISSPKYCCFLDDGDSILHEVIRSRLIEDRFWAILKKYPDLLHHEGKYGLTVFMAMLLGNVTWRFHNWDWDFAIKLVRYDPKVVFQQYNCTIEREVNRYVPNSFLTDYDRCLPLHRLATCYFRDDGEGIQLLRIVIRINPNAAFARDGRNNLPYDYFNERNSLLVRRLFLKANPSPDFDTFRNLNWNERRVGMFLGYRASTPDGVQCLLRRLRFEYDDLFRHIIFML